MRPLLIALLALTALPAASEDLSDIGGFKFKRSAVAEQRQEQLDARALKAAYQAVELWEREFNARVARVEAMCRPAVAASKVCEFPGPYTLHAKTFEYSDVNKFDEMENNQLYIGIWQESRKYTDVMGSLEGWRLLFATTGLWAVDNESFNKQAQAGPGAKRRAALERARVRYEQLRADFASRAAGLSEERKAALASCVSANGFDGYNEAEAEAVNAGTFDTSEVAKQPWQSFASDFVPRERSKGVCRDYAAVARDFLRAMGVRARVVGSKGHAMTELTLARGPVLLEPQLDNLNDACKLYSYPSRRGN